MLAILGPYIALHGNAGGLSHPLGSQSLHKLGNCCIVKIVWIPPIIFGGQCSSFLRLDSYKSVVAVNGEMHVWLDYIKQATGDSSMHDWALTCYSLGSGYIGLIKVWFSTRFYQMSPKGSRNWKPLRYPHMGLRFLSYFICHRRGERAYRPRNRHGRNSSIFHYWTPTMRQALF